MSKTTMASSNNLSPKQVDSKLLTAVKLNSFWDKFSDTSGSNLVHNKVDLMTKKGGIIYFGLRPRLRQGFLPVGSNIEGNESALTVYSSSVEIERWAFAIRDDGSMTRQLAGFNLSEESMQSLGQQGAENIDLKMFEALDKTNTKVLYWDSTGAFKSTATLATATTAITASNKLTAEKIIQMKTFAMAQRSDTYPLRPIKQNGEDWLVLLTHPDNLADLEQDSTFKNARMYALERGKSNPLFTGAWAAYSGVIIYAHQNIAVASTGGSGGDVYYTRSHLLGQQALTMAYAKLPFISDKDFDYGEEQGYAFITLAGVKKAQFNSVDYGSVDIITAATEIAGAVY